MPAKVVTITVLDAGTLYDDVAAALAISAPTVSVVFGTREPTKQTNQGSDGAGRVCIYPHDESGKAGSYGPPVGLGFPKRVLSRMELITVRVWAADRSDQTDDRKQYAAVIALENEVLNAIKRSASGRIDWTRADAEWLAKPIERSFGREKLIRFELQVAVLRTPVAAVLAQPAESPGVTVSMQLPHGDEVACEHE